VARIRDLLGSQGALAEYIQDFRVRPQQQQMAEWVEDTLFEYGKLVIEAGTGVGKTFAYLIPALLAGQKIIISTGTKHLQDQLYYKDLPVICQALRLRINAALLKGRANYLCLYRMGQTIEEGGSNAHRFELQAVREWSQVTKTGDIAEMTEVAEDSSLWPELTSTNDNCLGVDCAFYGQCYVLKARRAAYDADLVVINHHLFFADLALKEGGFGEVLPSANAFILDEAHQLPEVASAFFGTNLGSRQLLDLGRDTLLEQLSDAPEMVSIRDYAEELTTAVLNFRLALGAEQQRGPWHPVRQRSEVTAALDQLEQSLEALGSVLEPISERGKGLQNCSRRVQDLITSLALMRDDSGEGVHWFETFRRGFILHHTPLEIGPVFSTFTRSYRCAWILTSATLSVDSQFTHFTQRLGLEDAQCVSLDSPYDYENHALLYLPKTLPDPRDPDYTRYVVESAIPIIQASGGRTFVLFTSYRALYLAAKYFKGRLDYPLFVQGRGPRRELLEQFRNAGNAVLLGTSSFWEGVDVRGRALSCVIIDKLPFASPGDPVMQARLETLKAHGGNPFIELQIPQAVIALKQGVGRLIRDEQDTGVLMLCDPRLLTKPYGKIFLNSLPQMPRTSDQAVVETFLKAIMTEP
jgi:ATP-dependent DNA helicase DinG